MGVSTGNYQFGTCLGYSWGIRGVFVDYSWDIRMYRVCVGYVSGMYRESVVAYRGRMGFFDNLVEKSVIIKIHFSFKKLYASSSVHGSFNCFKFVYISFHHTIGNLIHQCIFYRLNVMSNTSR